MGASSISIHRFNLVQRGVLAAVAVYCAVYVFLSAPYEFIDDSARIGRDPFFDTSIISAEAYVLYSISIETALVLLALWVVISVFRQPNVGAGAQIAAVGILSLPISAFDSITTPMSTFPTVLRMVFFLIPTIGAVMVPYMMLTFPNGVFVRPWTIAFPVIAGLGTLMTMFVQLNMIAGTILVFIVVGGTIALSAERYRRHATPTQKQQTKWVVYGIVMVGVGSLLTVVIDDLYVDMVFQTTTYGLLIYEMVHVMLLGYVPQFVVIVGVALAIREQRLWDIDLLTNRSLVYGAVFLMLGLLYVGTSALILQALGGSNMLVALAVSAILPLSLFNWLRKRVQRLVDQRLFGLRYDINTVRAAQHDMDSLPDTSRVVGGYPLLEPVGRGGMGEVYRTTYDSQRVAIKLLPAELYDEPQTRRRFINEIEILKTLSHPGVVELLDYNVDDAPLYYVMQLVDGDSLAALLATGDGLPLAQAVEIAQDAAYVLDYLHSKDLIHRDVKPANMMVRPDNRVVLLDYGLAKAPGQSLQTQSNAIGTIAYMAPEQIAASVDIDNRADIYALGIILFEMLTGQKPYDGDIGRVLFSHLYQPAPAATDMNPDIPEHISRAIQVAMSKDPAERYPTASAFATALR